MRETKRKRWKEKDGREEEKIEWENERKEKKVKQVSNGKK